MVFNFKGLYFKWAAIHSIVVMAVFFIGVHYNNEDYMFVVSLSFTFLLVLIWKSLGYPYGIGIPNWVTTFRLIGIFTFFGFRNKLSDSAIFIGFFAMILLDGLDGFLARKLSQESVQGEVYDMETDAFLVAVLSWIHFSSGRVGLWLLMPGLMRYFFQFIILLIPNSKTNYLPKWIRSTIAVLFFLTLLTPFVTPERIFEPALIISSILILLSFGSDILFRLRVIR